MPQRPKVRPGRYTARMEGEFVVFVIGMRFNKLWKVHQWVRPFLAMPAMLRELQLHTELGLLGARTMVGGRTVTVIQYWRSFDDLEAFAKDPNAAHLPAWREFNRRIGASGDVGIFHETYRIGPGQHESIYANMPVTGLAAAGSSVALNSGRDSSRSRLRE